MERAAKPLTTRDTVLLIVHAADGEVGGRTVMQKLAYFSGLELGAGLGHRPHYYGPFSSKVEDAVHNAVLAGELSETAKSVPDMWGNGPDVLKYTYTLEEAGQARVNRLMEDHPAEWQRISRAVAAIKSVLPTLDQKTLSSAAKTFLIIAESEEGVDEDDIPKFAKRLGWRLTPSQVKTTVRLLEQLDLLDDNNDSAQP